MFVPPFDKTAMDGFGVKAENTFEADKFDSFELKNSCW